MMRAGSSDSEKRKKILEGTRTIFMREGVSSITMEQIAARQGISKKTLYKYFSNKNQLVEVAVEEQIAAIASLVDSIMLDRSQSFPQRLGRVLGIVARQLAQLGDTFIRDVFYREPQLWERIDRFRREHIFGAIARLFEEGIRDGYVRSDIEATLVPTLFVSAVSAILSPAQFFTLTAPPAVVFETFIKILLGGILTEEGRAQFFSPPPKAGDGAPGAASEVEE